MCQQGTVPAWDSACMGQCLHGTVPAWDSACMGQCLHGTVPARDSVSVKFLSTILHISPKSTCICTCMCKNWWFLFHQGLPPVTYTTIKFHAYMYVCVLDCCILRNSTCTVRHDHILLVRISPTLPHYTKEAQNTGCIHIHYITIPSMQ